MLSPKKITEIKKEYEQLKTDLTNQAIISNLQKRAEISQRYSQLDIVVKKITELDSVLRKIASAQDTLENEADQELVTIAQEELDDLTIIKNDLEKDIENDLTPPDPLAKKNIIVEIRAGAGGDEATLFAAELFRMYSRYAEKQGWKSKILNANRIGIGGFKEIIFEVTGHNVYGDLKYESGVHRVQRVPETEKTGRIHTSTTSVAVLPEAEEVDVQ